MNRSINKMTMRAIRVLQYGGIENLKFQSDVPIPKPAADEVLIKVKAAGINPVDTYIREGSYGRSQPVPFTSGRDGAGVIEEVGSEVKSFKKGDRVLVARAETGTFAEYCTAKSTFVGKLHDSLSFTSGAAIGVPYYTAYAAIFFKAKTKPGETVLVHGASGAVGIAAIQILKAHGCKVIGTAGTAEGLKMIKELGADYVFNHKDSEYMQKIYEEFTVNNGVDVVLEMLSNVNLQNDLEILAHRGRVIVIGCRGSIEINPRLMMMKETSIVGMALFKLFDDEWGPMHEYIFEGQKKEWLKPRVSKIYKLEEAAQGHHDVIHNSGTMGKLVIDTSL